MNVVQSTKKCFYFLVVISGIINEHFLLPAKRTENRKTVLFSIASLGILICFISFFSSIAFNQIRLQLYGEKVKAVVTKIYYYKGGKSSCYEFTINSCKYEGSMGRPPKNIEVGDSMFVTYLPSNPRINMRLGDE